MGYLRSAGWFVVAAALLVAGLATESRATHYPPGWKCYECHAVSASKIVPGTHLIKQSQKTFDLGITSTDPTIRCLFCHEAFRSASNPSGIARDRMKGVDHLFGAGALSKHPIDVTKSTFTQDATAFDCLDCHTVSGFDTTNPANPNIHGVDASQTLLAVNSTLVGAPADTSEAEISTKTCQNANCHDADGGTLNGYSAPPKHSASNAKLSLNDVAVASGSADADASGQIYCTKCHGAHGSVDGEALLVLQNTSGNNGQPATGRTVALDECDVCHTQDENGGLTDNYYAYGHGRILGGCDTCHELRHDTNGDNAFDPAPRLKANLALDTTAGTSTFGTNFYGNCRACHQGHAAHTPTPNAGGDPSTGRSAGCMDCHDQHGTTAADTTFQNDTMIRRTIQGEDAQLPGDLALIGAPPPDGTGDTYDGDWFNPGAGSPAVTTGVCDNVACHTSLTTDLQTDHKGGALADTTCATGPGCHATHLQAGKQGTTMGAASCDGCHGFPPATNAHHKHVDTAGFACEACHGKLGGSGGTSHNETGIVDKTDFDNTWSTSPGTIRNNVDIDLPYDGTNPNGAYSLAKGSRPNDTTTYGTCTALYCHGDDTTLFPAASQGTDTTPVWNDAATAACGTCHGATAAAPPGSNAHPTHAGSTGGYSFPCNTCHVNTTADGVSVIYPAHVNGQADVAFDSAEPRLDANSAYAGDAAVGSGYGACSNTYCHSQGLDRTAPFNGTNTAPRVAASWDSTTVDCSTCHDFGPSYANDTAIEAGTKKNSHPKHSNYGCQTCHQPTTTTGTSITTPAQHADVTFDLAPDTGAGVSFTVSTLGDLTVPTSCSSISCHGGGSATWGGTLSCDACHLGTSDVDDFTYNNGTTAVLSSDEWGYSGHGKASGSYDVSLNAAAAFAGPASDPEGCAYCHDFSVTHGTATNPFRLANKGTLGRGATEDGGWNDVCLVCHSAAGSGYDPDGASTGYASINSTLNVDANHYGAKHDQTTDGGAFCWDCHDPHGDRTSGGTGNIYMVQRVVTQVSDGTYGVPQTTVTPTFTNNTTGTDYAKSAAPYDGICQVCHTATAHYTSTSGDGHNSTSRCTDCHKHTKEFGASCVLCHGTDRTTDPNAPQVLWEDGSATGKTTVYGSHLKASTGETLSGATDWDAQCNKCHTGHSGPVTVPLPPTSWNNRDDGSGQTLNMQTQLGIDYTQHGGIFLGGTATSGATEAEICWNCHGTDDQINEWGTNADTNGTSWPVVQIPDVNGNTAGSYNYGWLYSDTGWTTLTPYWVNTGNPSQGMYRKDGYQHDANTNPSYRLSRRITSVHSVDFTMTSNPGSSVAMNVDASGNVDRSATQKLEPRSAIRCSYCHDVHDLNKAVNDTQSGRPHLRGTWMGNPYPPDMPPLNGYTYPTTGGPGPLSVGNRFSTNGPRGSAQFSAAVPRLWADATSRNKGGYFIDANSGRPTDDPAYDTPAEAAGLCLLCHGSDVDNMDYYAGSSLWQGPNGHSNSTLGGTGVNGIDLFDATRGAGTWLYMAHQDGVNEFEYGNNSGADKNGPFRADFNSIKPARAGGQYSPPRNTGWYGGTPGSTTRGPQYSTWYSAGGVGNDGVNSTAHKFPCSKCHSPHATGLPALLITNCLDKDVSNWSTVNSNPSIQQANNCHRKESNSTGWNRLAPQQ